MNMRVIVEYGIECAISYPFLIFFSGPMTEILFWEAKCTNLESLYEQLIADTTKKMASILQCTDSAYFPVYARLFKNVVAALTEAQDITLFLNPLKSHFQVLLIHKCSNI